VNPDQCQGQAITAQELNAHGPCRHGQQAENRQVDRVAGHLVGQHHLVLDLDRQMELEPEPLDDLGHLPGIVLVPLAAAAGLRQSFVALLLRGRLWLAPRRQGGGVAQVGDRAGQPRDQLVEDRLQEAAMRLPAEHLLESGHIPRLGHAGLGRDADEPSQAVVAAQFGEHGLGGEMAQRDPQDDDPPKDRDRIIVAALAAGVAE
jgi:hypothetical protein